MPKNALDRVVIEVLCGTCGTGHSRHVGYFRSNSRLTCEDCGAEISMASEQFRDSIIEFGQIMARLKQSHLN